MSSVYLYVGAGCDTAPFGAPWVDGTTIHCIDGQPHSEFGTQTCFLENESESSPRYMKNVFARPKFVKQLVAAYREANFTCRDTELVKSMESMESGLLDGDDTGTRRVVEFTHATRDIVIWYHFNSGLPEHIPEIARTVACTGKTNRTAYDGIICSGHWPHRCIVDPLFCIPNNTLTFRGYADTCFGVEEDDCEYNDSIVGRLSYDYEYRRKFKQFIFHDLYGEEHRFGVWEDYVECAMLADVTI